MAAFNFIQSIDVELYGSGVSSTATSVRVIGLTTPQGAAITTAMLGTAGIGYGTFEPETVREENFSFTGITDNGDETYTLTGVTRGLNFVSPYTQDVSLRVQHAGSTILRLSNSAPFYNEFAIKRNDETITGDWTFNELIGTPTGTSSDLDKAASIEYVNSVAVAGAPNASTTVKGIVQEATLAQTSAGTATGSTGARLYVNPENLLTAIATTPTVTGTYGSTITAGQPLYFDTGDSKWKLADASVDGTAFTTFGVALEDGVNNDAGKRIQCGGFLSQFLSGLTVGFVYLSDTAGAYSSSPGAVSKVVGYATSATSMFVLGLSTLDIEAIYGVNSDTSTAVFNESMTFFANTAITGAQATTLSAGPTSNADSLHTHSTYATALQDINANVKVFIGGFASALTASANVTRYPFVTRLNPSAGGGGESYMTSVNALFVSASGTTLNWDSLPQMDYFSSVGYRSTTAGDEAGHGFFDSALTTAPASALLTARHVAFLKTGAVIYASVADGTTQNRLDISSGLTLTNYNLFQIEMTGSSAIFKVNGTTVATLTTNYPTTAGTGVFLAYNTAATNNSDIGIKHPYAVRLTNLMTAA